MHAAARGQILIVDDEPEVVRLYQLLLGELGHHVASAASGEEALERISSQPLDVLITDIRMPGMNGLELLHQALVLEPDLQCIIISGVTDQQSAIEALKLGALSYLRKPVDFNELALTVSQGLQKVQLIRDARQSRRRLEQETTKNRLILEAAGAGIIGLDTQCLITFINTTAQQLLGLEKEELLGTSLADLIRYTPKPGGHYPSDNSPFACNFPTHGRIEGEGSFLSPCLSSPLPVYFIATPIEEQGRTLGRVMVFRDIRRELHAEEALLHAKQAAEAASHTQSRFLANMSHELRTPLNAILGHAQGLLRAETELNDDHRHQVKVIENSGRTLLTLIDELLEMARIDAGAFHLHPVRSNLPSLLDEFQLELRARLAEKGGELHYYESQYLPQWVMVDRRRLHQLLTHLADSMLRLSDSSTLTLTIGWHAEALQIEFAQNHQDNLTPLTTTETETLALLICRRLAQAMDGSVKLVFDELSRFRLNSTLALQRAPSEIDDEAPPGLEVQLLEWSDIPIYRLLLVAAPGSERDEVEEILSEEGLEVLCEESTTGVLQQCEHGEIDLILLDWGHEAIQPQRLVEQLRIPYSAEQLPILLLCDSNDGGCPLLPAGCQELLAKPLQHEAMLAVLTRHLNRRLPLLDTDHIPLSEVQKLKLHERERIRELIQRGRVVELRSYLTELEHQSPDCALLLALNRLARRFDFRSILKLIEH